MNSRIKKKQEKRILKFVERVKSIFTSLVNATMLDDRKSDVRMTTTDLVKMIFRFCEVYSGKSLYPYQEQFSKRVIRSALVNDGAEITALFSRQCIPKGELIHTRGGGIIPIEKHSEAWKTRDEAPLIEVHDSRGNILPARKITPYSLKNAVGLMQEI